MHSSIDGVYDGQVRLLIQAELPHHAVHQVLLDVDVEHHRRLCQPVLLVSEAQRREALRCEPLDDGGGVRRPHNVAVGQRVDMPDEVGVRPPGLLRERELRDKPKVSC